MKNFVGVIDSGVGGLTILNQLTKEYSYDFVYIADHAFCPYGTKPAEVVRRRAATLISFLAENGAAAIVIACNTASCFADELSLMFPLPIYEVISPTCRKVVSATRNKRVALLATNGSVNSRAYNKILEPLGVTLYSFPCSSFVPFVEQNSTATISCYKAVEEALSSLPRLDVDTVILGCTHFPLLKSQIAPYCGGAEIIECVCNIPQGIVNAQTNTQTEYYTTGDVAKANNAAILFGDVCFTHLSV